MLEILYEYNELQSSYRDLERENHELRAALITSQEDVAKWQHSQELNKQGGNQPCQECDRKGYLLKQLGIQLAECKSALEDHKSYSAKVDPELQTAREVHCELKSKCRN